MIEVENLTKRYGTHTAIRDISFTAAEGEVVGLLGPNGAGKTTTMRILTGFMPPTRGTARIAGFDVMEHSLEVRRRVGYMPERVPVYPDMTVKGYIKFWAKLRGVRNAGKRVDAVLQQVQLYDRRDTLVRNLSKGLRQRLGLAQALVHQPDVVILDEPTIGIDPQQVIEVRNAVRELGAEHTVLFSTHILSEAEQVCDRVVIIDRGQLIAQGKPDELRQQLQPGAHLYVQVAENDPVHVQKALATVRGVNAVTSQGPGFTVRAEADAEIRPEIVEQLGANGFHLLELRPVAMTLEDIFLDLVGRED